jgi:DNA-binding response OmpR family regulator
MKKVLIVEDDSFLQGLAANKLEKSDFDVTTTNDGEEALTMLDKQKFDVILLDLMLPDISGFDILKNMKESNKKVPVIVFSNLSDDANIKKAISLGANEYLIKSNFTLEELVEKVKKITK